MVIYRSFNDLVLSFIEYLRLVQPELSLIPASVARDLFVDAPSQQMAELYSQLRNISNLQSFFSTSGTDLNKLASNFNVTKKPGTVSTGTSVLTFNNLDTDTLISSGDVLTAKNGISFQVVNNLILKSSSINTYRATATRLRTQLDIAFITDPYAVEVLVESLTTGTSANVGPYSIISHRITGITGVTNLETFSGGSNTESDNEFLARILSVFSGSNTGTALGYTSTVESVTGVQDSVVIVPGDPLLIRDGTQTTTDSNGNLIVSEPGSGGKVDIYVLGESLTQQVDTFIYNDKSVGKGPTNTSNDYILGQRGQDTSLSISQRRVDLISNDLLPYQPVDSLISVAGSSSGSNFVESYTDSNGISHGNYTLIKDTGDYSGSSFGFDKLRWTSNKIELTDEEKTKGTFNGSDELDFTDVQEITQIYQDIFVTNENSSVSSSNRSIVTLKHTPIRSVNKVSNVTTGERYVIEDQNPYGTAGELNTSGKIKISGSTLPVNTDVLQVDYTWVKYFDYNLDFDNLSDYNANRTAQDSIDWSFGNLISNEPCTVSDDGYGNLTVTTTHSIYKVISVNYYISESSTISNGLISVDNEITNIISIKRTSDNAELYNTDSRDNSLSGSTGILLSSDSLGEDGDNVTVKYNASDLYSPDGYSSGTFSNNIITLPEGVSTNGTKVLVNYIANVNTLISETSISNLPANLSDNSFEISGTITGSQPTSNLYNEDGSVSNNLRRAGSQLRITTSSIPSNGSITITGTSIKKVEDALVTVTSGSGYEINLQSAILTDLSATSLTSYIKVVKLNKVERVNLDSSHNITSVDNTYDIVNYKISDNNYDIDVAIKDSSLGKTKIILPETVNNTLALLDTGDIVRVTFYYENTNDSELLYYSKNGELITNKHFVFVDKIYSSYGFKNAAGVVTGNIQVKNFNQPSDNTSYVVSYDYTAPKENERITITYNQNSLINTVTETIEDVRPITADVIIKAAKEKSIDVTIRIVLLSEYESQEQTVIQDAIDAVTSFLTASSMGTTIDASDVVNKLYSVQGIDRVRILNFSHGTSGNVDSITAAKNEYLNAGTINIEAEDR